MLMQDALNDFEGTRRINRSSHLGFISFGTSWPSRMSYRMDSRQERNSNCHIYRYMVILLCDGKLHFAPLDDPKSILDLGTGTGIWAIDSKQAF